MILRNHGLVTIGEIVNSAFLRMYRLILACEVQLKAMMTGQDLVRISDQTLDKSAERHDGFFRNRPVWPAGGTRRARFFGLDAPDGEARPHLSNLTHAFAA